MRPNEEKIYTAGTELRNSAFKPLNRFLTALGIGADTVSYFGLFLMIVFVLVLPEHPMTAFWLLFGRMLADIVDGPLARFQHTDSDRGKFVDVLMDNLAFALFIFGVLKAGLLNPLPALAFLFLTELVVVLMIIRYNLKHKSKDWHFYASAGSFPYILVYAAYFLFSVYAFGGHNWLDGSAKTFSFLLILRAIADYQFIEKAKHR